MTNSPAGLGRRFLIQIQLVLMLLALPSCHQVNKGQIPTKAIPTNTIVFEGTLKKLAPDLGFASGVLAVYRLAKYRVDRVCEGKYEGSEIVVDHLIFTTKEFEGIELNDRVCVTVKISNRVATRYDAEGIRSPSDDVKTFYVAIEDLKPIDSGRTCCDIQR